MSVALNIVPTPYIHVAKKRRKQTYYSKMDGNWSDPTIWLSNQYGTLPGVEDDVYVNHTVTANVTTTVNNLFVSGTLKGTNSVVLSVLGNIQAVGTVDFTSSTINLTLYGTDNFIVNFTGGNSTVTYARTGDQNIMNISYKNLTTSNNGTKYLISNLTVGGNVNVTTKSVFELSTYDFTVNGSMTVSNGFLSKSGVGTVNFNGLFFSLATQSLTGFNFSGNPTVYFRGGITVSNHIAPDKTFGSGNIYFDGNQSLSNVNSGGALNFSGSVIITTSSTVTVGSANAFVFLNTINGASSSSTLFAADNSTVVFRYDDQFMSTGVFNYTNKAIIGLCFNGNYSIPFTNIGGLIINGTGIKNLSGNTTTTYSVSLGAVYSADGYLECGNYDLSVGTTTAIGGGGTFSKKGAGTITFTGKLSLISSSTTKFLLSGNPAVNLYGGISMDNYVSDDTTFITGTSVWSIKASQTIEALNSTNSKTFNCSISIDDGVVLTVFAGSAVFGLNGVVNGISATSKLISTNGALGWKEYKATTQPMATGILDCSSSANKWVYNLTGNQEVKGTTYDTLELGGSGVKKLMGNVTVPAAKYSVTGTATVDLNGFTLTLT